MDKATNLYKFIADRPEFFSGGHDIHTPKGLVEEILSKIELENKTVLVLFNIEFVISLVYTYGVSPENITFYSDHDNKTHMVEKFGVKYCTSLDNLMKFDVIVGNPPYLQGTWRVFMQQALDLSNRYVLMVSPDGTIGTSRRNEQIVQMLKDGGIQSVNNCHRYFPGVITSSEICWYYFDKSLPHNNIVFDKPMSAEDILVKGIIDKIKSAKNICGGLNPPSGSIGKKDKKSDAMIETIDRIKKSGAIITQQKRSEVRIIPDASLFFYVNRFFGMNKDDTVYETTGEKGISTRIYTIRKPEGYTPDSFKRVYMSPLMRMILSYYRGTNKFCKGWSISELPVVPASVTDLYAHFDLTQEEIDYIKNKFE